MGRIGERLAGHRFIGIDTVVFIYQLEAHIRYKPLTLELLTGIQEGRWIACTSTVTLMELTVRPWQTNSPSVASEYEILLANFPNLTLVAVDRDVARQAARLRAMHRVLPADALQVATALCFGATAFVTNDRFLLNLAALIDIVYLDQLVG